MLMVVSISAKAHYLGSHRGTFREARPYDHFQVIHAADDVEINHLLVVCCRFAIANSLNLQMIVESDKAPTRSLSR
jgi:hypothetical protein